VVLDFDKRNALRRKERSREGIMSVKFAANKFDTFDHRVRLVTKSNIATIIPVRKPRTVERIIHFLV